MNFRDYPLDSQTCYVSFVSSDLSLDYLVLSWDENKPFGKNDDNFFMAGFSLVGHELKSGSKESKSELFSVVTVIFFLKREWGHYLLDIYLPSISIVAVSWISFWMEISAPPARITLGVTTMLTLVTVTKEARENLPIISYINALDIWFVVCTGNKLLLIMELNFCNFGSLNFFYCFFFAF
jgi:anionic glutamate receptor